MAENQLESSPPEGQELPTPEFSESGDSPTSNGADELVSKLIAQLEPIIEKKVQSVKDKRFSEIEKVLGGRDKMLAELEASGVTIPKEVRQEMRLRELEERLAQPSTQPAPAVVDGSTTQKAAVTEAIAKLQQYGLDQNDPAFIELLRGKYANKTEFDNKVLSHVVSKLAPPKPPSPADIVQSPATAQSGGSNTAQLIAELNEWQKTPSQHREQIKQRVAELDKRGWK